MMNRRDCLKSMVAAAGAVASGALVGRTEEKPETTAKPSPAAGNGGLPCGKIGDLQISRMLLGGNLLTCYTHARDMAFVYKLIRKYNTEMGKHCAGVSDDVMRLLMSYDWKGNIREMQNVIERAVIFSEDEVIRMSDVGLLGCHVVSLSEENESLQMAVRAYEREHICRVLNKYDWNKVEAAKALNIGLSSLYRKMDELGIDSQRRKHENKDTAAA